MNDLYLKLAQSQLGKNIFDALNLPKPPELLRDPDTVLSPPKGRVLVAAGKHNIALKQIIKTLSHDEIKLYMPEPDPNQPSLYATIGSAGKSNTIQPVQLDKIPAPKFRFIVFDATGFDSVNELETLYTFFHSALKGLKKDGRIVIVARDPESCDSIEQSALSESLLGFSKSVAKETGKKGATCNLLYLQKGADRHIGAPLYFLLSSKSAFITGQSLVLTGSAIKPRNVNWKSPLHGKTALVTGAAQGIGEKTARTLARDGATVVCLDIPANGKKLEKVAKEIDGHALPVDLSDDNAPQQILETITSKLGVIDIVIHNAGITRDKTLAKMPPHFWNQVININFRKVMAINTLLLEKGAINTKGRIICISSISGIAGNFGQTNYALSKSGIAGYTRELSKNLPDGITINAIAPGFIETDMTSKIPLLTREVGRRSNSLSQGGLPLDVAEAVSFFAHPMAQAANGNVLRVCGQSLLGR